MTALRCFNDNMSDKAREDFLVQAKRFKLWCYGALELWHERCADPRGGYAEFLRMDGRPDFDHIRRVRVQARQAYVYAHAAHLDWYEQAKPACDQAWNFLTGPGFGGADFIAGQDYDGPRGCAHLVGGDGSMEDDMRDLYAQAFVLLSGAWRFRAFGDRAALAAAKDTLEFINTHLKAQNGGWFEALPAPASPVRRQNPHMHLFEAMLALYEATQDKTYLVYADDLYSLFTDHFFDAQTGGVLEFFSARWKPHPLSDSPIISDGINTDGINTDAINRDAINRDAINRDGGPLEPGHMMEWCWLLRFYEKLSGVDVGTYADALYESAIKFGWNDKLGLLCNAVHLDGTPSNSNLRSWPQTELIKASAAQVMAGQGDKLTAVTDAVKALFDTYLNVAVTGGWADELSPDGKIISDTMPTSTFYHLFCAAAEVDMLAKKLS